MEDDGQHEHVETQGDASSASADSCADAGGARKPCAVCKEVHARTAFSRRQWKQRAASKCLSCDQHDVMGRETAVTGGVVKEGGADNGVGVAMRQLYLCSTGARVWALRRRKMDDMAAHDASLLEAVGVSQGLEGASDAGHAVTGIARALEPADGRWRRGELVARVLNKVEERVIAGVCETENWLEDAVAAVGLELDV